MRIKTKALSWFPPVAVTYIKTAVSELKKRDI